jgi:molybdopterin converting factor subunit 1
MIIDILAFGIAKEIFGGSSITIELSGSSIGYLKEMLEDKYPRLKQLASYMIAVNNEYANNDQEIKQGDEIAVIPPVSGG